MESVGLTSRDPFASTVPMPSIVTVVAFSVDQVSVLDWPRSIDAGLAVSDAVGFAGGGGGGGGGGVTFLWHAPNAITPNNASRRKNHFSLL